MAKIVKKEHVMEMYDAILNLKTREECLAFFEDLASPTELSAMEQRFAVATLLMQDKVYLEILEQTNASTATISRVKRMLQSGTGCMSEVISRMAGEGDKHDS